MSNRINNVQNLDKRKVYFDVEGDIWFQFDGEWVVLGTDGVGHRQEADSWMPDFAPFTPVPPQAASVILASVHRKLCAG